MGKCGDGVPCGLGGTEARTMWGRKSIACLRKNQLELRTEKTMILKETKAPPTHLKDLVFLEIPGVGAGRGLVALGYHSLSVDTLWGSPVTPTDSGGLPDCRSLFFLVFPSLS